VAGLTIKMAVEWGKVVFRIASEVDPEVLAPLIFFHIFTAQRMFYIVAPLTSVVNVTGQGY